jgi:F-type H+-transporting ATPase subunit b
MPMTEQTPETRTEAPSRAAQGQEPDHLMSVSAPMMGLTWLTFILMSAILYKAAWKPILAALERREAAIRKAKETADQIAREIAQLEDERAARLAQADGKAQEIIEAAHEAANEAARAIESKARDEAQIFMENAQRDIERARENAVADLRRESADLAVRLAGQLVREDLDDAKHRALTDRLIREM